MLLRDIVITPFPTERAVAIGTIASAAARLADIGPWRVAQFENRHVDSPNHVHTVRPSRATRSPVRPSLSQRRARAAPQTQQKPSIEAVAAPDGSLKRQAGRKPAQKAKLLVEYAQLQADKGGWKVGAGALCRSCPAAGGACPAAGGYAHPCIQLVNCVCAQFQAFQRPWRRSTQSPEMSPNTTYRNVNVFVDCVVNHL